MILKMTTENLSRKTLIDFFWKRMRQDVGLVPPHLENILNMEGLSGSSSLGEMTMAEITSIGKVMRDRGVVRVRHETSSDTSKSMRDFFRDYEKTPDLFTFSVGDKLVLRSIMSAVKLNGICRYIPISNQAVKTSSLDENDERDTLITRIKQQLSKWPLDNQRNRDLFDSIGDLGICCERGTGGRVIAWVTCMIGGRSKDRSSKIAVKELKVIREPTRSWPVNNLLVHFDKHVNSTEKQLHRKRKTKFDREACDQGIATSSDNFEQQKNITIFGVDESDLQCQICTESDCAPVDSNMQRGIPQTFHIDPFEMSNREQPDTPPLDYSAEEYYENGINVGQSAMATSADQHHGTVLLKLFSMFQRTVMN
ncbi:uncharacterized protein LOC129730820 [Wyeomyia smithii]|uniref:uncharacterized protein LOC129730820 n=1 Tax=Wyeomyia smithii TaxID=174621 RepID=UPI00246809F3|nr:uncharacterized protein LOC129730820 [Wyeomyia smithii]